MLAMPRWRTSTWIWLALLTATIVAEVIYATSDDAPEPGSALAVFIVISIVFAVYRLATRGKSTQRDQQ